MAIFVRSTRPFYFRFIAHPSLFSCRHHSSFSEDTDEGTNKSTTSGNWQTTIDPLQIDQKSDIPVFSTATMPQEVASDSVKEGNKPLSLWPGVYRSPVTAALWNARSSIVQKAWNVAKGVTFSPELITRTCQDSRLSVIYKFSTDLALREQYRSPWNAIRIGKLLEDLDALAGTISLKHCSGADDTIRPLILVTASVDKISLKKSLKLDIDLKLAGAVAWVGNSSMQVRMEVIQPAEVRDDDTAIAVVANFTFVARDPDTNKAACINYLAPETEKEKELFAIAQANDMRRKQKRLQKHETSSGQQGLLYQKRLQDLLTEGRMLVELPALADRNSILIRETRLENAITCQPQQRNLHGRIFGGFLMRRAFELAFSTCYVFGGHRPVFLDIDHVDFLRPVDVGDLLRFKSCVLYTERENIKEPLIHVEVVAVVTRPESRSSEVSNTFYFTFTLDAESLKSDNLTVHKVLPATEEEARRCIARYDADHCDEQ